MTTPKSMRYRCNCGGRLYVKETRAADDAIYRVRKCANCTYLFTTKEVAIEGYIPKHARLQTERKKNRTPKGDIINVQFLTKDNPCTSM